MATFEEFKLAHEGEVPVIYTGYFLDINPKYREEIDEYKNESGVNVYSRPHDRNNMYLAWMMSKYPDFFTRTIYIDWVTPDMLPFYLEDDESIRFNDEGYRVYKEALEKIQELERRLAEFEEE